MSVSTRALRRALCAAVALVVIAGLAACHPDREPTSTSSPSTAASPTAISEPKDAPWGMKPESRYDLDCADLAGSDTLAATHAAPVTATDPLATELSTDAGIPTTAVVQQVGGLACGWTNGEPLGAKAAPNPAFVGTIVFVLPDAAVEWAKYVAKNSPGDSQLFCGSNVDVRCVLNEFTAGSWIEVTTVGLNAELGGTSDDYAVVIQPLLEEIRTAISRTAVADLVVEQSPVPIPTDCESVITAGRFSAAGGVAETVAMPKHGGWSLNSGASIMAGAITCLYLFPNSENGAGAVRWLPNGGWAATAGMAVATYPSVALDAGLLDPGSSWYRCAPANGTCTVDVAINGNWVQAQLWAGTLPPNRRAGTIEIMNTILDVISTP